MKKIILSLALCLFVGVSLTSFTNHSKNETAKKYYALVIAIDDYQGSEWTPLKTPINDGNTIKDVLLNKYGFEEVITLYDKKATRANIIDSIDKLAQNVTENDNLLIYFSGHGVELGEEGYWVPSDARTKERSQLIPNSEIKNALSKTVCKHALIMVDACFSSTIFKSSQFTIKNDGSPAYYKQVDDLPSRQAITAGGLEPVLDGAGEHSTFAKYLIKNLKKNQKPVLDATELFEMLKYPIQANSPNTPRFGHIQNTGHEGGQFVFKINKEGDHSCNFSGVKLKEGSKVVFSPDGGTLHAMVNEYDKKVYYQWIKGSTTLKTTEPYLKVTESGEYSVLVSTDDECSGAAVISVLIALPQVSVTIQEGSKVNFTSQGTLHATLSDTREDIVYEWKYNDYIIGQSPTLNVSKGGIYEVVARLKDGRKISSATTKVSLKERSYTIRIGDNMARIARKFYGDETKETYLYKVNSNRVNEGELLRVGVEILVPVLEPKKTTQKVTKENSRLLLAANGDMPPFSQIGLYNNGMLTEMMKATFKQSGQTPVVQFMSGDKVKAQTFMGKSTAAFPYVYNEQEARFFLYSEPLYKELTVLFVNQEPHLDKKGREIIIKYKKDKDLKGRKVAVVRGFVSNKLLQLQKKGKVGIVAKKTWAECFALLKEGKVDIVAAPQMVGVLTLKNMGSNSLSDFKILSKPFETTNFYLIISKKNPNAQEFLNEFNASFKKLQNNGEILKIQNTHIDIFQNEK